MASGRRGALVTDYIVSVEGDEALHHQLTYKDAVELARQFVREDGLRVATVFRSSEGADRPRFAVWRERYGVNETIDRAQARGVHDRFFRGLPENLQALRRRANEQAEGDNYEGSAESFDVLADASEQLGLATEAERARVAAQRLRVAIWFAQQFPRLEHVTWERVQPVKRRGTWTFFVTPWDNQPGEHHAVRVDRRGQMRFVEAAF